MQFYWSGCGGNSNNYYSEEECLDVCTGDGNQDSTTTLAGDKDPQEVCAMTSDHGGCSTPSTRYYFQPLTGTCQPFKYSGCQGNENNFHSLEECHHFCKDVISNELSASTSLSTSTASISPVAAVGTVSLILDSTTSSSLESTSHDNVDGALCSLKPEKGTCAESLTRYHYVPELENCVSFIYSGCGVITNADITLLNLSYL